MRAVVSALLASALGCSARSIAGRGVEEQVYLPAACLEQGGTCPTTVLKEAPVLVQRRTGMSRLHSEEQRPLRVLCWNVLYTNFGGGKVNQRNQLATVMVDTMKADIAGLQECMNEYEMQTALGSRMKVAPGTDTFNCIAYKPDVVAFLGESGRRYLGDDARDSYSQRFVSYAKMEYRGKTFFLFSTHWCLDNACAGAQGGVRHKRSAQVILDLRKELQAEGLPAIIAADANSHMDGYDQDDGVRHLLANGFTIAGKGPMAGGIDYVFVTNDFDVVGHSVGPTAPSDHPSFFVELTWVDETGLAPSPVTEPIPSPTPPPSTVDDYRHATGVGGWGGTCTCPSGQAYNVGDKWDGCANGPQSLACEGGVPGECFKVNDAARNGMKVTCAGQAPVAVDDYRHATGVGGWGGTCTCPSGQAYNVGDKWDGCANGPQSLACEGGVPGECLKVNDAARNGMKVTCG